MHERERTKPYVIRYALYLYFLGLSLRATSKAIEPFVDRSYVAVWYWIQEFNPKQVYPNKKKSRITAFIIDETQIQIGSAEAWLWVATEPIHHRILGIYISRHRNMLVAGSFLRSLVKLYGKHIVYSDGGTWYPEACVSLGLKHRLHSSYEKSIIERVMEYVKDRTENFDDYYPCKKKPDCNFNHVYRWFMLFITRIFLVITALTVATVIAIFWSQSSQPQQQGNAELTCKQLSTTETRIINGTNISAPSSNKESKVMLCMSK